MFLNRSIFLESKRYTLLKKIQQFINSNMETGLADFDVVEQLGHGSFGSVVGLNHFHKF